MVISSLMSYLIGFVNTCSVVQTTVTYKKDANVLCNAVILY